MAPVVSPARDAIAAPGNEALVSSASVLEIAIKQSSGKLAVPGHLLETVPGEGFTWLPVTAAHAFAVVDLPLHHTDPFDRLLIAQARAEDVSIVTRDPRFDAYDVAITW